MFDSRRKPFEIRRHGWLLLALLLLLAGIAAAGMTLYQEREQRYRHRVEMGMKALSELQVRSVAEWRRNHISNAMALTDDSLLAQVFMHWQYRHQPQSEKVLSERLRILVESNRYTMAVLVDASGRPLLTSGNGGPIKLPQAELQAMRQALDEAVPVMAEPRRDPLFAFPFFGVFAPLYDGNEPAGAIWLVGDMRTSLYPLLETWLGNSLSAETVLVQRSGGRAVNISPLRHGLQDSLGQLLPMMAQESPGAPAFQEVRGVVYGRDYRGKNVLAVTSAVPDSPWLLISKIDVEDAFADEPRKEGLALGLFIGLGLLLVAMVIAYWQRKVWQRERALKQALERNMLWLNNAQKAASVGYFAYDVARKQFYMSDMACSIFGLPVNGRMSLAQWVDMLHPQERSQVLKIHATAMAERTPLQAQYRIRRKCDGLGRWVQVWGEYESSVTPDLLSRMAGTVQDITERKQAEEQLESYRVALEVQVRTDPLTGVANRRALDEAVAQEWNRAMRTGRPLALLMVDIDHFKPYNDCYGHLAGDQCLRQVAQAMQGQVERAGDLVARFGGEEFAVLLPETSGEQALQVARRLCDAVRALALAHDALPGQSWVSVSIGVASVVAVHRPGDGAAPYAQSQQLFRQADGALYRAKQSGRDQACLFQAGDMLLPGTV
jgi:diguanylate cyclase (GGDEF)-like protein/PAS domain S-box-containing protein